MKAKQLIFIMTDTQRRDMISIYNGKENMHTENLDQLAREGLRFDKAYTCQPVCGPARSALFTGLYPHSNGMLANLMWLGEGVRTIGHRMKKENIHTAYIGKWHLDGGDYFGDGKCPEGFDEEYWYDMRNYIDELTIDERVKSRDFNTCFEGDGIKEEFTYAYRCTQRALKFIEENKDKDYLLIISYDEPHGPFLSPKKYFEPFKDGGYLDSDNKRMDMSKVPDHIRLWHEKYLESGKEGQMGLLGCNSYVDSQIGRVLDSIKENAPDSLLIYSSDHGDAMGSHGIYSKGAAMYDEVTNIPFIVKWKGKTGENLVEKTPISQIDLVPTILDYFDRDIPKSLEGKSILPLFKDQTREDFKKEANHDVFIEFNRYEVDHDTFGGFQPIRSIVRDNYKLVINLMTSDELFDMDKDPAEMNNLINDEDHREIRDSMHDALLDWQNRTRDPMRGYYWACRPWRSDKKPSWDNDGMTRRRYTEDDEVRQLEYGTALEVEEFVGKNT